MARAQQQGSSALTVWFIVVMVMFVASIVMLVVLYTDQEQFRNDRLAAIAAKLEGSPSAVLFEKVKGFKEPVFTGLYWSRDLLADLLGCEEKDLSRFVAKRISNWSSDPMPPVVVKSGPVKQVTMNEPDVNKLPVPIHTLQDCRPYLDVAVLHPKEPDSRVRHSRLTRRPLRPLSLRRRSGCRWRFRRAHGGAGPRVPRRRRAVPG